MDWASDGRHDRASRRGVVTVVADWKGFERARTHPGFRRMPIEDADEWEAVMRSTA